MEEIDMGDGVPLREGSNNGVSLKSFSLYGLEEDSSVTVSTKSWWKPPRITYYERNYLDNVTLSLNTNSLNAFLCSDSVVLRKTLQFLSGREFSGSTKGDFSITVNGVPIQQIRDKTIGYLDNELHLMPNLTVKEYLIFFTRLSLAKNYTNDEIYQIVANVAHDLEIHNFLLVMIGPLTNRNITPFQQKLIFLACELVSQPSFLFANDVLDDLNSMHSIVYMKLLKKICRKGVAIIISIEKPSSDVVMECDDVVLFTSKGELAYHGSPQKINSYFKNHGIEVPAHEVISTYIDITNADGSLYDSNVSSLKSLIKSFHNPDIRLEEVAKPTISTTPQYKSRIDKDLLYSFTRAIKLRWKVKVLKSGLFKFICLALLFMTIFVDIPYETGNGRFARQAVLLLSSYLFFNMFCYFSDSFWEERTVITREKKLRISRPWTYFLGIWASELALTFCLSIFWTLAIYFLVPFLYTGVFAKEAILNFIFCLFFTADIGAAFLQMIADYSANSYTTLCNFLQAFAFWNIPLTGFFIKPYNMTTFWASMVWISPLHFSWSGLIVNEMYNNYRYREDGRQTLLDIGLWIEDPRDGIDKVIILPRNFVVLLAATAIVFRFIALGFLYLRKT